MLIDGPSSPMEVPQLGAKAAKEGLSTHQALEGELPHLHDVDIVGPNTEHV